MNLKRNQARGPIARLRVRSVAPEGSVRLKIFYEILPRISDVFRQRRMRRLVKLINIRPGMRVLDLGGTPTIWEHFTEPLEITLLNLPGGISSGMSPEEGTVSYDGVRLKGRCICPQNR